MEGSTSHPCEADCQAAGSGEDGQGSDAGVYRDLRVGGIQWEGSGGRH